MENKYRKTQTTVSLINYHFVFCPRYRRKIFNIEGLEDRFKTLVKNKCKENSLPTLSPSNIMQNIKSYTSKILNV